MAFFDHFSSEKPTLLGQYFVRKSACLVFNAIKKYYPGAQRLLEIGPGRGDFCRHWLQEKGSATALEANIEMAQALEKKGVEVIRALAPPLPFADGSYDVAVASHVIEHMPTVKQAMELVEEMARICRPGGVVCIVAPDIRAWRFDFWNADYTHNYVTTPRRIEQLFLNTGLKIEGIVSFSGYFPGVRGQLFRTLAWLLPATGGGGLWAQRLYKLKLTFLGNFLIIGRKS